MKILRSLLTVGIGLGLSAGIASAQDDAAPKKRKAPKAGQAAKKRGAALEKAFAKLDSDSNKKLSESEFIAAKRWEGKEEAAKKAFARIDENDDGSVTLEEMKKAAAKRGKREAAGGKGKKKRGAKDKAAE